MYFKEIMCTCVSVYRYVHMSAGACKGQKKASNFLQLELWVVVSCLTWVMGTGLGSSVRAVCTLNRWAIFLALDAYIDDFMMIFDE